MKLAFIRSINIQQMAPYPGQIAKTLDRYGIEADLARQDVDVAGEQVAEAVDLDEAAQLRRLAQRKRLGPYRPGEREPYRDKDIRALVRAGFPVSLAMRVVDGDAE